MPTDTIVETKDKILSIDPALLQVNSILDATSAESVAGVMMRARDAGSLWAARPRAERMRLFRRFRDLVLSEADRIVESISKDNGKTKVEALAEEIFPVLDAAVYAMKEAPAVLDDETLSNTLFPIARISSRNTWEPAGVVAIISPWNFPFSIPTTQILMALAAGNAVVFKPSSLTPLVGQLIGSLFREAGFPEHLIGVVQGPGEALGNALIDARPDRIIFTGSVEVGKQIMRRAADHLIPVTLELGGKDPMIVFPDADLERAASAAVWGAFTNAGQACASVERLYVHRSIAPEFIDRVTVKTRALKLGSGLSPETDMGPLIGQNRLEIVESHIEDAIKKGAIVVTGGHRPENLSHDLKGWFFEPTVLKNVDHNMIVMRQETFGPVLPIMTFETENEVVSLANDSDYGLTASVWTKSEDRFRRISRKIRAGTVINNDVMLTYGFSQVPWGGVKYSGFGRTHGEAGLRFLASVKNLTTVRLPLRRDPWWYPHTPADYKSLKAMANALFVTSLNRRLPAIVNVLRGIRLNRAA